VKKINFMVALLLVVFSLIGCSEKSSESVSTNATEEPIKIGFALNTLNNPFFVDMKNGVEAQAKESGVEVVISDAQNNPAKQLADVENFIQQKVDVLMIDPADSDAIVEAVRRAKDANIPVFTIDRVSNGGDPLAHIGYNQLEAGEMAAKFIVEKLDGKGKVVEIQGILGTSSAQDRTKGFNDYIKKYPDIEIIAQQAADYDRGKGLKVMEDILQANPEIDAIFCANDESAIGAISALESSDRLSKIKAIIGVDAVDPALDSIRKEKLTATVMQSPYFLGKEGIKAAIKIAEGETVEKEVIMESKLVTKENVDDVKIRD
jgi:ribose transport system substrate-binding protein